MMIPTNTNKIEFPRASKPSRLRVKSDKNCWNPPKASWKENIKISKNPVMGLRRATIMVLNEISAV